MAESSSSSSLSVPLSNSEKSARSPRNGSPRRLTGSDKIIKHLSPRSPRQGDALSSAGDGNQNQNGGESLKGAVSPRSAPLAMLVKNLGIRPADGDVVPFVAPVAPAEPLATPSSSSAKNKSADDDDWDDGPDSKRASTLGRMESSSGGLTLEVNYLPTPEGLFDPTPRAEPAAETAANQDTNPALVAESASGSTISSGTTDSSASVVAAAAPSATAPTEQSAAPVTAVVVETPQSQLESQPPEPQPQPPEPQHQPQDEPQPQPQPQLPPQPQPQHQPQADSQEQIILPVETPAAVAGSAAAPSTSTVTSPVTIPAVPSTAVTAAPATSPVALATSPSWNSAKVETNPGDGKSSRPLSAELQELRKLQAEVRRLKSTSAATQSSTTGALKSTPSGGSIVSPSSSSSNVVSGSNTSPRSASSSAPPLVDQSQGSQPSPVVTPASTSPPTTPVVPPSSQPTQVPIAAVPIPPVPLVTTPPASKGPIQSPPVIRKPAAVEPVPPPVKPTALTSGASPTIPPALAKPVPPPKVIKKGDPKPSVFSLFGMGGSDSATPAPAGATAVPPSPTTPPVKSKNQITNLHEAVRMKSSAAAGASQPQQICRICQVTPMTHFFQPCGHRAACLDCASEWLANVRTCPLCSQNATAIAVIPAGATSPASATPTTEMGLIPPTAQAQSAPVSLTPAPAAQSSSGALHGPPASAALMGGPPPVAKGKQHPQLTRYASIRQVGLFQYLTAAGATPEQLQEVEKIDVSQPSNVTSDIKEKKIEATVQKQNTAHYEEDMYNQGVKLFNEKPKKGVEFLIQHKLLEKTGEDVAEFLYTCEELDKVKIGEILGEPDPFHMDVLRAFVASFDFRGLDFDIALRKLLFKFRLPGEAQKIDRVMNAFAVRYYLHNKSSGVFKSSDAVYVLAFAVIMLNTDLHNPQVKKKMSKSDFLKNNRGINEGENLPEDFLEDLYERIRTDEIKMKSEGGKWGSASKKGWLTMRKGKDGDAKQQWFILCDGKLHWMRRMGEEEVLGNIPLSYFRVQNHHPKTKLTFHLVQISQSSNPLRYHFVAPNERELTSWVNLLQTYDPQIDLPM